MEKFPEPSQEDYAQIEVEMQIKDMMATQEKLSERCFVDCMNEFRNKSLTDEERKCSQKCFQKYMNSTQRMAMRWAELSQKAAELQQKK